MKNRTINMLNSAATHICLLMIVVCALGIAIAFKSTNDWNAVASAFAIIEGVTVVGWIAWMIYAISTKANIKPMAKKPMIVMETISYAIALVWVFMIFENLLIVIPTALLYGWYIYRLIHDSRKASIEI